MIDPSVPLQHVGHGPEPTLLEYFYRVLLHLVAFGAVALVAVLSRSVFDAVRSVWSVGSE